MQPAAKDQNRVAGADSQADAPGMTLDRGRCEPGNVRERDRSQLLQPPWHTSKAGTEHNCHTRRPSASSSGEIVEWRHIGKGTTAGACGPKTFLNPRAKRPLNPDGIGRKKQKVGGGVRRKVGSLGSLDLV